jgi:nitrate/nitrite transport system substrate-binding protein
MTDLLKTKLSRRAVLQAASAGAVGVSPALRSTVYAQGSDKPEKEEVKIGFIPLTDCASVVMASVLGIDKKYGVKIIPSKEASPGPACATSWSAANWTLPTCCTA